MRLASSALNGPVSRFLLALPSAGLLQRSAYSTLALIHCGDTLDRHPRLGALPIGHFGSDPLGSDVLRSVSLDQTPSAWTLSHRSPSARFPRLGPLGSATPGAARTSLTYGLSKAPPVLAPWISAAPVLSRSGLRPLRCSGTQMSGTRRFPAISRSVGIWCQVRRSPVRSSPRLLQSLAAQILGRSVPQHSGPRCMLLWHSAVLSLFGYFCFGWTPRSLRRLVPPELCLRLRSLAALVLARSSGALLFRYFAASALGRSGVHALRSSPVVAPCPSALGHVCAQLL